MFIKSLKLKNIRSYENQEINFPLGSILLAGDIGSGKSSILLAIEFALFGIKRKYLSASSLLSHGKKEGEVELTFDLNGKEITIKRKLKRGKEDIKQEAGYIIRDNIKKEGVHIELKTDIFDLLGYPKNLVSKTNDLIYRYTVYTPQEQMKEIILEDKDIRLDTLRKVFNIDKYKIIRENLQIYIRELKERRKNYEGKIEDLEEKKELKKEKNNKIKELESKLQDLLPRLVDITKEVHEKKGLIAKKEKEISEFNRLKKDFEIEDLKLKNILEKRKTNINEIEKLIRETDLLKKELIGCEIKELEELSKLVKDKEIQISHFQKMIIEVSKKLSNVETKIKHSCETKEKIERIDQCPVCLQKVTNEHKKLINEEEEKKISELEEHLKIHEQQEKETQNKIKNFEDELRELRKRQTEIKVLIVKKDLLEEKERKKLILEKEQEQIKQEIGKINAKKMELSKKIEDLKGIESEYKTTKQELEVVLEKEKREEINKKALEVEKEEINKLQKSLEEEINKKLEIKKRLNKISQYQNWMEEYFINLMNTIEKHVMLQVYREFNGLFQQWFNILIGDESFSLRLDDEFTPIIEQNGYETNVENLSGGERTAVALAYRLALNKVINDISGEIKTKDILMLDEPTDGFSAEQLDKIRIVLEQLNIKQVIIVSHEPKIESFVDNVLRISKSDYISKINCV